MSRNCEVEGRFPAIWRPKFPKLMAPGVVTKLRKLLSGLCIAFVNGCFCRGTCWSHCYKYWTSSRCLANGLLNFEYIYIGSYRQYKQSRQLEISVSVFFPLFIVCSKNCYSILFHQGIKYNTIKKYSIAPFILKVVKGLLSKFLLFRMLFCIDTWSPIL